VVYEIQVKHVLPFPIGERPNFQLLMALHMKGEHVRLLKTVDTAVRRVEDFACVGEVALAHYAAGEIDFSEMPVCFARSFAIYMLSLVKAYSPNCGSRTDVVALYNNWDGEMLKQQFVRDEELQIAIIANLAHTLTVNSFAHRGDDKSLQESLDHLKGHILSYRKWEKEQSDERCRLPDQFLEKKAMIRVGAHGLTESKGSAMRRKNAKESEPEK
jgi:hypothetical protein